MNSGLISKWLALGAAAALAAFAPPAGAQQDCLSTTFESNNGWAGNMFDIRASRDLDLQRWQVNVNTTDEVTIEVYWREGSYQGYESDPEAWTLLGSGTTQGQGSDYPTTVNVGADLLVAAGQSYGIYVHFASYVPFENSMRYTRGEPTVFENDDLRITTGIGRGFPAFYGEIQADRMWNGAICYKDARPHLVAGGTCPGVAGFEWSRAAPDKAAGIVYGERLGTTIMLEPCWGIPLEIQGRITLLRTFRTGPEGRGRIVGMAQAQFCGGYLQLVVTDKHVGCVTSNVAQVP